MKISESMVVVMKNACQTVASGTEQKTVASGTEQKTPYMLIISADTVQKFD